MNVSDSDVLAALTADGAAVADHFLVAGLVCAINNRGEPMAMAIDDEDLAVAMVTYLRQAGVPEYASFQLYHEQMQR